MHPTHPPRTAVFQQIALITFLTFAARGLVLPFANLYLSSVGFTGTQIGLLISLSALAQLTITPWLHTLADRAGGHRRLYYGLLASNILALTGIVSTVNQFFLGGSVILRDLSDTPAASLLSQLTITHLDREKRSIYGRLRAWGSFGWAVTTFISGRIIAAGGYPLLFVIAALCNLAVLPFARVLPERTTVHKKYTGPMPPRTLPFYIILGSFFLLFVGSNAIAAFSFIYFRQELGASNEMIGFISSVAALSEIPAMILMDRLLRRFDIRTTLVIGIFGLGALWFAFTLMVGPALLIPLMAVRGTFFTLHNVSSTLLVARISHPANVATNQALAQVTIPGLALLLTGSISGWLFDTAGPRVLFQIAALMALTAAGVLLLFRRQLGAEITRVQTLQETEAAVASP